MEKIRVKKGERYWWIRLYNGIDACADCDYRREFSTANYNDSNYFATKEEAEAIARKIRAVLKGADVIEMPSEEEMLGEIPIIDDPCDYIGPGRRLGWRECFEWLKSKIVK